MFWLWFKEIFSENNCISILQSVLINWCPRTIAKISLIQIHVFLMSRTCWKGEEIVEVIRASPSPLPCLLALLDSCLVCFWNFHCLHHPHNDFILPRAFAWRPFSVTYYCKVLFSAGKDFVFFIFSFVYILII